MAKKARKPNMVSSNFVDDTQAKIHLDKKGGGSKRRMVPAMSIRGCGGVLVITPAVGCENVQGKYVLTHLPTGHCFGVDHALRDVALLVKAARRFWSHLDKRQRNIWLTETDVAKIKEATPLMAIEAFRTAIGS